MVRMQDIEEQLQAIGSPVRLWGRAELRELQHVLQENEEIKFCLNGRYEGGFALLCVTNLRILLVDKKLFYLTLEDIRYDMIVEVDYNYRLLDATISVFTPNKTLRFTCYKKLELRKLTTFIQGHVMDMRQQPEQAPQPSLATYQQQPEAPKQRLPQYQPREAEGTVTVQNLKTFIPRLPLRRRVTNVYTNTPLAMKRSTGRNNF